MNTQLPVPCLACGDYHQTFSGESDYERKDIKPLVVYHIRFRSAIGDRLLTRTVFGSDHATSAVAQLVANGNKVTSVKKRSQFTKGTEYAFGQVNDGSLRAYRL